MLTFLTGRKQKTIAWFLFLLFYADLAGTVYASRSRNYIPVFYFDHHFGSSAKSNDNSGDIPPVIKAELIKKTPAKSTTLYTPKIIESPDKITSPLKVSYTARLTSVF